MHGIDRVGDVDPAVTVPVVPVGSPRRRQDCIGPRVPLTTTRPRRLHPEQAVLGRGPGCGALGVGGASVGMASGDWPEAVIEAAWFSLLKAGAATGTATMK
jgi:hypothetical protein